MCAFKVSISIKHYVNVDVYEKLTSRVTFGY